MSDNMTISGVTVGEALRIYRQRADMTIGELSVKSGINRNTISAIEKGTANPRLDTIGEIMNALGLRWRTEIVEWTAKRNVKL